MLFVLDKYYLGLFTVLPLRLSQSFTLVRRSGEMCCCLESLCHISVVWMKRFDEGGEQTCSTGPAYRAVLCLWHQEFTTAVMGTGHVVKAHAAEACPERYLMSAETLPFCSGK